MQLYEYAVIYAPKGSEKKNADKPKLIAFDKVLANDEKEAQILVARQIPETYLTKLSEVKVAVRPF